MIRFIGRRLLYLLPVLLGVALLTFLIASLLPGDLAYVMLGDQATPETLAALRRDMGLDRPIWWRFLHWLGRVAAGRPRPLVPHRPDRARAILERLPVSIELMLMAEIGALAIAIPLAIVCAVNSGGRFDRTITGAAFASLSLPSFLSAILLIYVLAVWLQWLPSTGYVPLQEDPVGNLRSFMLPALTLASGEWPVLMRVLRSDMISTLQEDYIAMAKAKGLRPARILLVHALKPSSLTLVTVTGINIGRLLGGALIVEYDLRAAGRGAPAGRLDLHARPDRAAGRGAVRRRRLRDRQLRRRHAVRDARPADPPWPALTPSRSWTVNPRAGGGSACVLVRAGVDRGAVHRRARAHVAAAAQPDRHGHAGAAGAAVGRRTGWAPTASAATCCRGWSSARGSRSRSGCLRR